MAESITVVRIENLSKRFVIRKEKSLKERVVNLGRSNLHKDDFWALKDINLDIKSGSTIGLIGPNGSGKSTLLKMIGGILQPTSGTVSRRGRLAALLELGTGFHPDLTGRENVFLNASILGLTRHQTEKYFDAIVDFSGIEKFIDTQVKFYSSGMYVRLAFAVAVHVDPDLLLVDEVLAVGDEPFQRKCMDRIRNFQSEGRTIILVTHALDQVAELCDRAVVLEHGDIVADGAPREALRHLRADFELAFTEDRERERSQHRTDGAHAGPRASVTNVRLQNDAGSEISEIKPGTTVEVVVSVSADDEMANWILGIGIDTPLGQVVYGTNTRLIGATMPTFSGKRAFTISLPNVWLGDGTYGVHAALAQANGVEIDRMEGATLRVDGTGAGVGYLHVDPSVRT
jgi:ABC-2 type transport system ATP-binding protein